MNSQGVNGGKTPICTSSQLIDDDERVLGGGLDARVSARAQDWKEAESHPQNCRGFDHLRHESRNSLELTVTSSNTAQDGVEYWDLSFRTRDPRSDLGHERNDSGLRHMVSALVWSQQNHNHTWRI